MAFTLFLAPTSEPAPTCTCDPTGYVRLFASVPVYEEEEGALHTGRPDAKVRTSPLEPLANLVVELAPLYKISPLVVNGSVYSVCSTNSRPLAEAFTFTNLLAASV